MSNSSMFATGGLGFLVVVDMSNSSIFAMGGLGFLVVVLLLVIIILLTSKSKKDEQPEERVSTPITPSQGAARTTGGCPSSPYTYCSSDTINKIYIVDGCGPSNNLVEKLVREGKISGRNDPKVVNCSKNIDVCTAAGIRSYPSVKCDNAPSNIYEGFCA